MVTPDQKASMVNMKQNSQEILARKRLVRQAYPQFAEWHQLGASLNAFQNSARRTMFDIAPMLAKPLFSCARSFQGCLSLIRARA